MPEIRITVDVNLHADSTLASILDNLIDCWASDIIVRAGGEPTHRQENLMPPTTVDAAQEFGATSVSAVKEREINELNSTATAEPPAVQDEKLTEAELVEIRAKAQAFMKADGANKDKDMAGHRQDQHDNNLLYGSYNF